MDFYDDEFFSKRETRSKFPTILTSLFSAVIGGLIVLLLLPTFINIGIIDISNGEVTGNLIQDNVIPVSTQPLDVNINTAIVDAVEKVKPAVVGVVNIQEQNNFWNQTKKDVDAGEGSGVVFDVIGTNAYIVTNYHVIQGAKEIEVALYSGERIKASVVGADALTDLAVISIDKKYVEGVAEFGDSTNIKPGEPAIAIGNPLGQTFSQTVTVGVISSSSRSMPSDLDGDGNADWETNVLQTDAAINPGNSGGALVNIAGQVIGINSAKISDMGIEGLGFAIPISDAKPIIYQLIENGKVIRPQMGISPYDLQSVSQSDRENVLKIPDSVNSGVVLLEVTKLGAAELAGLKKLDVIVKIDDFELKNSSDLRKYLYNEKKVGDKMEVTFYREGKLQNVTLTLSEYKS
ncbi:MAG: S1C family serine protease [Vulcanibacillus sp.]